MTEHAEPVDLLPQLAKDMPGLAIGVRYALVVIDTAVESDSILNCIMGLFRDREEAIASGTKYIEDAGVGPGEALHVGITDLFGGRDGTVVLLDGRD